jgi:hypothetical protein
MIIEKPFNPWIQLEIPFSTTPYQNFERTQALKRLIERWWLEHQVMLELHALLITEKQKPLSTKTI